MRADRRWHTRKEKKEWARRLQSNDPGLNVIHPQAAGIDVGNASHMGRWKTEGHFVSWLGLCPDNRITGNKVVGRGTRHVVNRAATAMRMAANALLRSQT